MLVETRGNDQYVAKLFDFTNAIELKDTENNDAVIRDEFFKLGLVSSSFLRVNVGRLKWSFFFFPLSAHLLDRRVAIHKPSRMRASKLLPGYLMVSKPMDCGHFFLSFS